MGELNEADDQHAYASEASDRIDRLIRDGTADFTIIEDIVATACEKAVKHETASLLTQKEPDEELRAAAEQAYAALLGAHAAPDSVQGKARLRLKAALGYGGPATEKREAELRGQLPNGMKHCTIKFIECEKGHGRLTAANWIDNGCAVCRIAELESQKEPDEDQILAMCGSHWVDEAVKRRIAELEATIAQRDERITELWAKNVRLRESLARSRKNTNEAISLMVDHVRELWQQIDASLQGNSIPQTPPPE